MIYIRTVILVFCVVLSSGASAKDGQGTITEIVNCGGGDGWKHVMLFKLSDGGWFGVLSDHKATAASDSGFGTSMIMTAFTARLPVEAHVEYGDFTYCGITASIHWDRAGDYIKILRD